MAALGGGRPKTQYVESNGARLAYQVVGDGEFDLVFVPGFASHLELQWGDPAYARFLRRLASLVRLIVYDKRGVGMSDRVSEPPTLEQHVADLLAVTEAAGSTRAIVLGFSDGSPTAGLYTATYPGRCAALIMCSSFACTRGREEIVAQIQKKTERMIENWGEGYGLEVFAPSLAGSRLNRTNYALFERASLRPEMARAMANAASDIDISGALRSIAVPALVLHRRGDFIPFEAGVEVGNLIPHAKFVELEGSDHVPFAGDTNSLLTEVEDFVRGVTERPRPPAPVSTVLFTDIVGSTQRLVDVGDQRWREMIEAHDELTRAEIARHGGEALKSTGDGWLALFESPPQAVRAAWAVGEQLQRVGLDVRAGVHVGPVERSEGDVRGLTVHAAARIAAAAGARQVLASEAVVDLCSGSGICFEPAGSHELKGLPGRWDLSELGDDPSDSPGTTELVPGPALGGSDRAMVAFASRLPAVARAMGRLARPSGSAGETN